MEKELISKQLRESARSVGLCDEWYNAWRDDESLSSLVGKFVRGIDFCIEHDWPSVDYVLRHFPPDVLAAGGVYCSFKGDAAVSGVCVFMGDCDCRVVVEDHACATVFVRHDSRVRLACMPGSVVQVRTYDSATVEITNNSHRTATVITHRAGCKVSGDRIKVIER